MNDSQRNKLYNVVVKCRELLEHDLAQQLEGVYGIHDDGTIEHLAQLGHLDAIGRADRQAMEAAIAHDEAIGEDHQAAVAKFIRESAFTFLNRLAALKLMEDPARGLIQPSIIKADKSKGFTQFALLSPEAMRAQPDGGYRLYLRCLFDDLAQALGVLFDRSLPTSRLFPTQTCMRDVLTHLNNGELADIWREDETIGWVYQYFTPGELREQARKASSAPRNSYELAFRNQFYTPRYVVAFLADNTLGRTWYEMRKGNTRLTEECDYLIRRPLQVFLNEEYLSSKDAALQKALAADFEALPNEADWPFVQSLALMIDSYQVAHQLGMDSTELGDFVNERAREYHETGAWRGNSLELWLCLFFEQRRHHHFGDAPEGQAWEAIRELYVALRRALQNGDDIKDEDVLAHPVYVGHRPKKDPRHLRVLDPACGSGHFLLYCFVLLLTIYEEAYDDPDIGRALQEAYPEREAFQKAVPGLILAHNLYGIDIDRRACQIASLALWLRAQRAYADLGLKLGERPRIEEINIVCAEPMPGEYDLLGEFVRDLQPAILGNMLRDIWDKMKLAGEAGSLLKIEQEIQDAIGRAREKLVTMPQAVQMKLFEPKPSQQYHVADLGNEEFWAEAEQRVLSALRRYSAQAMHNSGITRRLFADDAAQGMAFIDTLQKPFDVVLMNPPFGAASKGSKDYIYKAYPRTKNDLYTAFVERGLELLRPGGHLGAITSRTGFFLQTFQDWRRDILLEGARFVALADLGHGVLDTAMVETAAYVIERRRHFEENGTVIDLN